VTASTFAVPATLRPAFFGRHAAAFRKLLFRSTLQPAAILFCVGTVALARGVLLQQRR
jgi:hypothetical protein